MRLHFFSENISGRRYQSISKQTVKLLSDSYLGFVVIRPGSPRTLGRTLVSPPTHVDSVRAFFPVASRFESNFLGMPLSISTAPYLSQDSQAMACATAALWMSSTTLSRRVGLAEYQTADITSMALSIRRPYGPSIGERGLSLMEMEHALLEMGYDPKIWQRPDAATLLTYAYLYTESGVPPVIFVNFPQGGHAITVIGHLFDTSNPNNNSLRPGVSTSTDFIPGLVIHDDQNGPYLRMDIHPVDPTDPLASVYKSKVILHTAQGNLTGYCQALIVPVPQRAMMPAGTAIASAASWISNFQRDGIIPPGDMLVRGFLIRSNRYKQLSWQQPRFSSSVIKAYRGLQMPRYVWVVEFTHRDSWVGAAEEDLSIEGEFIFDSTFIASERPDYLAVHLPWIIAVRHRTEHEMRFSALTFDPEASYKPLSMPIPL